MLYFVVIYFFIFYCVYNYACDLYIAPSLHFVGHRGVIAGKAFENHDLVSESISIFIPTNIASNTQLSSYYYNTPHNGVYDIPTGVAGLFNHNRRKYNVEFTGVPSSYNITHQLKNHYINNGLNSVAINTEREYLSIGEELFGDYGAHWFAWRDIEDVFDYVAKVNNTTDIDEFIYTMAELERVGVCISDTSTRPSVRGIRTSDFPIGLEANSDPVHMMDDAIEQHEQEMSNSVPFSGGMGMGLFAERRFCKGELVVISPVMVIPLHLVMQLTDAPLSSKSGDAHVSSLLLNYIYVSEASLDRFQIPGAQDGVDKGDGGTTVHSNLYSDVALFPFGHSASINHRPDRNRLTFHTDRQHQPRQGVDRDQEFANVAIEWFAFDTVQANSTSRNLNNKNFYRCISMYDDGEEEEMEKNSTSGTGSEFGYDVFCDEFIEKYPWFPYNKNDAILFDYLYKADIAEVERMTYAPLDVAFRATADIEAGEEIFVDYGSAWEIAFDEYVKSNAAHQHCLKFLLECKSRHANGSAIEVEVGGHTMSVDAPESCGECKSPKQFLFPMTFPNELFPVHWMGVQCIGADCPKA